MDRFSPNRLVMGRTAIFKERNIKCFRLVFKPHKTDLTIPHHESLLPQQITFLPDPDICDFFFFINLKWVHMLFLP